MDIVLPRVTIVDPSSPFHQQTTSLFIQNGYIAAIGEGVRNSDLVIEQDDLHIVPGFVDPFAHFCDPGLETRETLETGARAAAAGGYTDVLLLPNTSPVADNKNGIAYSVQRSSSLPVSLHPVGAVTKNTDGKELAEMYDMGEAGAVAFSDGLRPVQASGLLLKALQYLKAVNKVLIQVPDDVSLSGHGMMNEGIVSTRLGLPGQPHLAEELMIARDLELARYTGGRLHISGVSTAGGLQRIRAAKAEGLEVSCSVTPYHLFFTDDDLVSYDTNLKLTPPLRTATDREALQQGLLDGSIDSIASHHVPRHTDDKVVEFEYAKQGMIGLETAFAAVRTALPQCPLQRLVEVFSTTPRRIFGLPPSNVQTGQPASLCLLQPHRQWTPSAFFSKSLNSAFAGKLLNGLPLGIIHKDRVFLRP